MSKQRGTAGIRRKAGVLFVVVSALATLSTLQSAESAGAADVVTNISTACTTTIGFNFTSSFPITTNLSPNPIGQNVPLNAALTLQVPAMPLAFTLQNAVITFPIPTNINPATVTATFDSGITTGTYSVSGTDFIVTETGPTPLSTSAATTLPTIHFKGTDLANATSMIDFKVPSSIVAHLTQGATPVTANCTPTNLAQVMDMVTVIPQPKVNKLSPTTGLTTGGFTVTLTGTNFTGATAVKFGGTPATSYTVVNDTTITAVAPAHFAGAYYVYVTTATGTSTAGYYRNRFIYMPMPKVTKLSPTTGSTAGGYNVTVTGVGFTYATAVKFGGLKATTFTIVNDTTINVTAPAHVAGAFNVFVTTPVGTSAANYYTNRFVYT